MGRLSHRFTVLFGTLTQLAIAPEIQERLRARGLMLRNVEDVFWMGSPLRFSFGQNFSGLCSLRLAYSYDAMSWRHPKGRPTWLELGQPGEFDAGFLVPASELVDTSGRVMPMLRSQPQSCTSEPLKWRA